jgi:heme exporter protein B
VFRDAWVVAAKDLRIEARSRVALNQIAPFAVLVLVLFAFALDPDRDVLERAAPGLYWVAVLLVALLAVQRSSGIESGEGVPDALRLSGLDAGGLFLGKALAVALQLLAVELLLGVGVVVLYDIELSGFVTLAATVVAATAGLAASGTLYGVLAVGSRVRETLLPLLLLPIVAPVLIASTRATEAALGSMVDADVSTSAWLLLLVVFAVVYVGFGVLAYGSLLEDS